MRVLHHDDDLLFPVRGGAFRRMSAFAFAYLAVIQPAQIHNSHGVTQEVREEGGHYGIAQLLSKENPKKKKQLYIEKSSDMECCRHRVQTRRLPSSATSPATGCRTRKASAIFGAAICGGAGFAAAYAQPGDVQESPGAFVSRSLEQAVATVAAVEEE